MASSESLLFIFTPCVIFSHKESGLGHVTYSGSGYQKIIHMQGLDKLIHMGPALPEKLPKYHNAMKNPRMKEHNGEGGPSSLSPHVKLGYLSAYHVI